MSCCVSRLVEENCHSVQSFHMRRDACTSVHMLTDVAPNAYTWIPTPTNHIKDWMNIHLHCHVTRSYSASYLEWTFCFCGTVTDDDTVYFAWLQSIIQPLYNMFSTSASTSFQISPTPYRASIWNKNSVTNFNVSLCIFQFNNWQTPTYALFHIQNCISLKY